MKKLICLCLLLAAALLTASALAANQGDYLGDMRVYKCKEWVTLRAKPDSSSKRLSIVELDKVVTNCYYYNEHFTYCEFEGKRGYISSSYLTPLQEPTTLAPVAPLPWEDMMKDEFGEVLYEEENLHLLVRHGYSNNGEVTVVCGYQDDQTPLWGYMSRTKDTTELALTGAFMGGTEDQPLLLMYNTELGLRALSPVSGEEIWLLPCETVQLGASLTTAVDEMGTMYIAGFYGPDPVAVNVQGEVLWESNVEDDDVFWPYEIEITANGILTRYDSFISGEEEGYYEAFISLGGEVLWVAIHS